MREKLLPAVSSQRDNAQVDRPFAPRADVGVVELLDDPIDYLRTRKNGGLPITRCFILAADTVKFRGA